MLKKWSLFGFWIVFSTLVFSQSRDMVIQKMEFATAIENRQPVSSGSVFSTADETVFCFTQVYSSEIPTIVSHVWYHNDEETSKIDLEINGKTWRTWSKKSLSENWAGKWRVDVVSWEGEVLQSKEFTVVETRKLRNTQPVNKQPVANARKRNLQSTPVKNTTVAQKNTPPVSFKLALITDVDLLLNLIEANDKKNGRKFNRTTAMQGLQTIFLNQSYGQLWLIQVGGQSIGYAMMALSYSMKSLGINAFLDELYIRDDYLSNGVEEKLIQFLEQTASTMGINSLQIKVDGKDVATQALNRHLGYSIHDWYLMSKELK